MFNEKRKILICEDELITAINIKQFLEKKDFFVYDPVTSGRELMERATDYFPSLIISDITLKGELDGIEAISRISELVKIPYIFITGYPEYMSLIDSYFLKPVNTFVKPLDLNKLYLSLSKSLFHSSSERPSYYYLG